MDEVKGGFARVASRRLLPWAPLQHPRRASGGPLLGLLVPGGLGRFRHSTIQPAPF